MTPLTTYFFDRDPLEVAKDLLGKVIRYRHESGWLSVMIVETEAYYLAEKGSHASLGFTQKRKALFMPAGTIYMYYSRGGDSLNISCHGEGNAVLIKSAIPHNDSKTPSNLIDILKTNLLKAHKISKNKPLRRLCSGQTLLCKALGLRVKEWDQKQFDYQQFYFEDVGYHPDKIVQTTRLGIPLGRDEHLPYRFIDFNHVQNCTKNPMTRRAVKHHVDYVIINTGKAKGGSKK